MGYCGFKDAPDLWDKKSKRDTLSIEIAADIFRLGAGIVSSYYYLASVLFRIRGFAKQYTIDSCTACSDWERCVPTLYDSNNRIVVLLESIKRDYGRLPGIFRIPFLYSSLISYSDYLLGIFSDRVEDLSFVGDETSRQSLRDLVAVCKEAAPKLDDWRKSMDFLN